MTELTDVKDLLWFTGFFDGEGCVQLHRGYGKRFPYYELMLSVTGTHRISIKHIIDVWNFGRVNRHEDNRDSNRKPSWDWVCYGHNALSCLKSIYPHSITKKNDILIGITFQEWKMYEVSLYGRSRRPESSYKKEELFKQLLSNSHDVHDLDIQKEVDTILHNQGKQVSMF